jgi:hypothetical protein
MGVLSGKNPTTRPSSQEADPGGNVSSMKNLPVSSWTEVGRHIQSDFVKRRVQKHRGRVSNVTCVPPGGWSGREIILGQPKQTRRTDGPG